jgi:hypothetical protein
MKVTIKQCRMIKSQNKTRKKKEFLTVLILKTCDPCHSIGSMTNEKIMKLNPK